jgi:ABC-type polysaccharide/polyol phosphate transport system ATPase subunit
LFVLFRLTKSHVKIACRVEEQPACEEPYWHSNCHLIELKNVVKVFETPAGKFYALRGISLRVDTREFVAVIGRAAAANLRLSTHRD